MAREIRTIRDVLVHINTLYPVCPTSPMTGATHIYMLDALHRGQKKLFSVQHRKYSFEKVYKKYTKRIQVLSRASCLAGKIYCYSFSAIQQLGEGCIVKMVFNDYTPLY